MPMYMHGYVCVQSIHVWMYAHMNMSLLKCISMYMCVCMHARIHVCVYV